MAGLLTVLRRHARLLDSLAQLLDLVQLLHRRLMVMDQLLNLLGGLAFPLRQLLQFPGVLLLELGHLLIHLRRLIRLVDHLAGELLALRGQAGHVRLHGVHLPFAWVVFKTLHSMRQPPCNYACLNELCEWK